MKKDGKGTSNQSGKQEKQRQWDLNDLNYQAEIGEANVRMLFGMEFEMEGIGIGDGSEGLHLDSGEDRGEDIRGADDDKEASPEYHLPHAPCHSDSDALLASVVYKPLLSFSQSCSPSSGYPYPCPQSLSCQERKCRSGENEFHLLNRDPGQQPPLLPLLCLTL